MFMSASSSQSSLTNISKASIPNDDSNYCERNESRLETMVYTLVVRAGRFDHKKNESIGGNPLSFTPINRSSLKNVVVGLRTPRGPNLSKIP